MCHNNYNHSKYFTFTMFYLLNEIAKQSELYSIFLVYLNILLNLWKIFLHEHCYFTHKIKMSLF